MLIYQLQQHVAVFIMKLLKTEMLLPASVCCIPCCHFHLMPSLQQVQAAAPQQASVARCSKATVREMQLPGLHCQHHLKDYQDVMTALASLHDTSSLWSVNWTCKVSSITC
jgi:hypothetical protein